MFIVCPKGVVFKFTCRRQCRRPEFKLSLSKCSNAAFPEGTPSDEKRTPIILKHLFNRTILQSNTTSKITVNDYTNINEKTASALIDLLYGIFFNTYLE